MAGGLTTAAEVRALLDYDSSNGLLTWRAPAGHRIAIGDVAGSIHRLGYRVLVLRGRQYAAHRIVWLHVHGEWPKSEIDHINGHRSDNRIENLREATRSQNMRNRRPNRESYSGLKGAHWNKSDNTYRSVIVVEGKHIHLGCFRTAIEAHEAYCRAAAEKFGDFARFA
jgi:hypothetical protein